MRLGYVLRGDRTSVCYEAPFGKECGVADLACGSLNAYPSVPGGAASRTKENRTRNFRMLERRVRGDS